jgi:hypothetical protein
VVDTQGSLTLCDGTADQGKTVYQGLNLHSLNVAEKYIDVKNDHRHQQIWRLKGVSGFKGRILLNSKWANQDVQRKRHHR